MHVAMPADGRAGPTVIGSVPAVFAPARARRQVFGFSRTEFVYRGGNVVKHPVYPRRFGCLGVGGIRVREYQHKAFCFFRCAGPRERRGHARTATGVAGRNAAAIDVGRRAQTQRGGAGGGSVDEHQRNDTGRRTKCEYVAQGCHPITSALPSRFLNSSSGSLSRFLSASNWVSPSIRAERSSSPSVSEKIKRVSP